MLYILLHKCINVKGCIIRLWGGFPLYLFQRIKKAYNISAVLDKPLAIVSKRRKSAHEVEATTLIGDVKDKDVLLVDDLTETAGTLTSAAELLKREGAKKVFACVSHALLNDIGIQRLRNSEITELITTDSVPNQPVEVISVASLLGEAIVRIHKNLSVTSLFN